MKSIAVIMPSRGLPFARTLIWLEKQREKYPIKLYMSHDLSIPECFNDLINKALKGKHDYFLFLEDDIVPPINAIRKLLKPLTWSNVAKGVGISCIDYPFRGQYNTISRSFDNEILSCGTGCTMVARSVFEALKKPYFRSDRRYDWQTRKWSKCDPHKVYGLQDMWFTYKARHAGFKIVQVSGECTHLGLVKMGEQTINKGCHEIGERPKIAVKLIKIDWY
jgi:hypothetical protein